MAWASFTVSPGDDELDAAVLRPGLLVGAVGDRALLAVAHRPQPAVLDAEVHQVALHRAGAPLTESHVVLLGAPLVAVALEGHGDAVLPQALGEGLQRGPRLVGEGVVVEGEANRLLLAGRRRRHAGAFHAALAGAAIGILAALGLGAAGAIPALEAGAALRIGGAGHAGAVVADPAAAAVTVRLALRGGNAAVATRRIQLALEALLAVGVRTALLAEAVDADAAVTVD